MAIKRSPEDFQVEEILSDALRASVTAEPGPFALYRLSKQGLATPEAAATVSRKLGLPHGALAYAGLKDKHAATVQHVTVKAPNEAGPAPEAAEGPGWRMERIGFVPAPLTAQAIETNRFRILVRALSKESVADMDQAAGLLRDEGGGKSKDEGGGMKDEESKETALKSSSFIPHPSSLSNIPHPLSLRIVNYFGDQRFGSARHGQGFLAKHLIRGEFEAALRLAIATEARKDRREQKDLKRSIANGWGKWRELLTRLPKKGFPERRAVERLAHSSGDFRAAFCALPYFFQQLCVYAYQSHLWNAIARRLIAEHCAPRGPVLAAGDVFGEMLFPAASAIPAELTGLDLPLLARKTELKEPWKNAADAVLSEEGIALEELRIPGVRRPFFGEDDRRLFMEVTNFALSPAEPDEAEKKRFKRRLSFDLPRGAYATVVLRALGQ